MLAVCARPLNHNSTEHLDSGTSERSHRSSYLKLFVNMACGWESVGFKIVN